MNLDQLKVGETVLTSVRAINRVASDPSQGKVLQIEVAERVATNNLLAIALSDDDRIIKNKPQRAWMPFQTETFIDLFNIEPTVAEQLRNLQVSTGLKPDQYVEGTHYVKLNIANPTVLGDRIRLQIKETTVKPNDRATPMINPKTQVVLTNNGLPIYRVVSVVNTPPNNVRLSRDVVGTPIPEEAAEKIKPNVFAAATT